MRTQTIKRRRADTAPVRVEVVDHRNDAADITGASFLLTVNSEQYPTDTSNQLFQASGSIIDAAGGIVDFPIPGTSAVGDYYYDVQMTDNLGKIETVAAGRYTITQDITK
jgi:hypothetical protein